MKALISARPRRGSCSEYCSSISGAAILSTTERSKVLPQNFVNHSPTTALLSSSMDMCISFDGGEMNKGSHVDSLWQHHSQEPGEQRSVSCGCIRRINLTHRATVR